MNIPLPSMIAIISSRRWANQIVPNHEIHMRIHAKMLTKGVQMRIASGA